MHQKICFIFLLLLQTQSYAAINDLYPGDYIPADSGRTVFALYAYQRQSDGVYSQGLSSQQKQRDSSIAVFLIARYFDLGATRMAISGSTGYARQTTRDTSSSMRLNTDGGTDPKLSITLWPIRNDNGFHYMAVNLTHIFGVGSYDNTAIQNIGQNRDRSALSVAWVQKFHPALTFDITGELARYGTNENYGLHSYRYDQRPTRALTSFLRYALTDSISPYLGFQQNWGGESLINDAPQGDSARMDRAYLGLRFAVNHGNFINVRAETDTRIVAGYKLNQGISLRWTMVK